MVVAIEDKENAIDKHFHKLEHSVCLDVSESEVLNGFDRVTLLSVLCNWELHKSQQPS